MLNREKNERLTRVGPGTPAGELLRRYWHPICAASELTDEKPKKRVKILDEQLIVFRTETGEYACLAEQCAHRGCSLYYGFIEGADLRCPYHGWKFDKKGSCLEQPFEPPGSTYKDTIHQQAYPVQQLGGLIFIYMGPLPAPLLPRWAPLVRVDGSRRIEVRPLLNCNWLQAQENSVDTVHTYFLHGHTAKLHGSTRGQFYYRPIEKYEWKYCEWGIEKKMVYGGDHPEEEIRPPMIFPNILIIDVPERSVHWRVPLDDMHTQIFTVMFTPSADGSIKEQPEHPPVDFYTGKTSLADDGDYDMFPEDPRMVFFNQDRMAWETQGAVYDRSKEHLGASDRGIAMFRKLLEDQIEAVENGRDPIVVLRDPAKNQMIDFEGTLPILKDN